MSGPSRFPEDLELERAGGRYHRYVGDGWVFADRVFGGYTAALATSAARRESPHQSLLAAHVVFLEGARPGAIEIDVTALRSGRSTWVGRSVAHQAGRPILTCDLWFGDRGSQIAAFGSAAEPDPDDAATNPEGCAPLRWLWALYPFMSVFDEAAISYPGDIGETGGPARVEVWAKPAAPVGDDPFVGQMAELMLADAHLLDAALRPQGLDAAVAVSLDLSMRWERPRPTNGWLRFVSSVSRFDDEFVSCDGTIRDSDGALRASAGQQGVFLTGRLSRRGRTAFEMSPA